MLIKHPPKLRIIYLTQNKLQILNIIIVKLN